MKTLFFLALFSLFLIGCGGQPTANNTANNVNSAVVSTPTPASANNPLATATATPVAATNDAPTLQPVYQAFSAAIAKKDIAAIRKVYSAETLKKFEEDMKADNVKSLIEHLELDDPKGSPCSVKNEEIKGDTAEGTLMSKVYPNGLRIVFVKENGEWKMTNRMPGVNK